MNETLRAAKKTIRAFIVQWTDQKLADVYAFNADGKMLYSYPCQCLVGVHSSAILHEQTRVGQCSHYGQSIHDLRDAEDAYLQLNFDGYCSEIEDDDRRQRVFSSILRAEMRRRDRIEREVASQPCIAVYEEQLV